jgi:hypothetical protein
MVSCPACYHEPHPYYLQNQTVRAFTYAYAIPSSYVLVTRPCGVPGLRSLIYQPMGSATHDHDGMDTPPLPAPPPLAPSKGGDPASENPNPGEPAVLWRSLQDEPRKARPLHARRCAPPFLAHSFEGHAHYAGLTCTVIIRTGFALPRAAVLGPSTSILCLSISAGGLWCFLLCMSKFPPRLAGPCRFLMPSCSSFPSYASIHFILSSWMAAPSTRRMPKSLSEFMMSLCGH